VRIDPSLSTEYYPALFINTVRFICMWKQIHDYNTAVNRSVMQ
jgi:hypothetical protein